MKRWVTLFLVALFLGPAWAGAEDPLAVRFQQICGTYEVDRLYQRVRLPQTGDHEVRGLIHARPEKPFIPVIFLLDSQGLASSPGSFQELKYFLHEVGSDEVTFRLHRKIMNLADGHMVDEKIFEDTMITVPLQGRLEKRGHQPFYYVERGGQKVEIASGYEMAVTLFRSGRVQVRILPSQGRS